MQHTVVSQNEWLAARKAHLANEKALTRTRDELSRQRRELPWVKVDKSYIFDGPDGEECLSDLFAGKSQLIIYHLAYIFSVQNVFTACWCVKAAEYIHQCAFAAAARPHQGYIFIFKNIQVYTF